MVVTKIGDGIIYRPTANGYFSGIGGLEIGMQQAGVRIQQSLDLDPDAIACMKMNPEYFNHKIIHKDIKDQEVLVQDDCDVMLGTYPCNRYSPIGDIHGVRTGDDLYLHYFRHLALKQPEAYVLENVPGMKKFRVVMEAMTKLPGYYYNMFCPLDASLWLPQRRERLIIIATKRPFTISAPLAKTNRPGIKDIYEGSIPTELTSSVIARINGKYRDLPIIVDPKDKNAIAPTVVAHYYKDKGTRLIKDKGANKYGVRPFTVREYARLQGFPDDFNFPEGVCAYRLIGNAVAVDMGRWIGQMIMRYFNNIPATRAIS
jgi:DNA (cytosine-5)-methyltransferase 1